MSRNRAQENHRPPLCLSHNQFLISFQGRNVKGHSTFECVFTGWFHPKAVYSGLRRIKAGGSPELKVFAGISDVRPENLPACVASSKVCANGFVEVFYEVIEEKWHRPPFSISFVFFHNTEGFKIVVVIGRRSKLSGSWLLLTCFLLSNSFTHSLYRCFVRSLLPLQRRLQLYRPLYLREIQRLSFLGFRHRLSVKINIIKHLS